MSVSAPTHASTPQQLQSLPAGLGCPRCQKALAHRTGECPACLFSLPAARRNFPFAAPPLDFIVDPTQVLPEDAAPSLEASYEALRQRFPQVRVTLSILKLAPGTPLNEFSFWWFNDAPEADEGRQWHLLLLFDAQTGALSLTPGYALEPYLFSRPSGIAWRTVLDSTASTAASSGWATAFNGFLQSIPALLEDLWWQEQKTSPVAP